MPQDQMKNKNIDNPWSDPLVNTLYQQFSLKDTAEWTHIAPGQTTVIRRFLAWWRSEKPTLPIET